VSRRLPNPDVRIDPVIGGVVGALVIVGGGLAVYGTSQKADEAAATTPPAITQADASTDRALAAVRDAERLGAVVSQPTIVEARAASARGLRVDPFRGKGVAKASAAGGAGATAGASGTTGSTTATASAAGSAAKPGTTGSTGASSASTSSTAGADSAARMKDAEQLIALTDTLGAFCTAERGGTKDRAELRQLVTLTIRFARRVEGAPQASRLLSATSQLMLASQGCNGDEVLLDEIERLIVEAGRLIGMKGPQDEARPPKDAPTERGDRVSLRIVTQAGRRARSRAEFGLLVPTPSTALARVTESSSTGRVVLIRLRQGVTLHGPQSAGTKCIEHHPESSQDCRIVRVRTGRTAVLRAPSADGNGPIAAIRILSVWRDGRQIAGKR
jgi:hypothetical protein